MGDYYSEKLSAGRLKRVYEIAPQKSRDGRIVCRDGFTATTVSPEAFRELTAGLPARVNIYEVDGSSLFCEICVR